MAFPGSPEADLILLLQTAVLEIDGWRHFLGRLAHMTGARFATVVPRARGTEPFRGIVSALPSGAPMPVDEDVLKTVLTERMRPERIYSAADLADLDGRTDAALPARLGVTALRAMRATTPGGASLTLAIFGTREFEAADGAVLRQILPYLQAAARAADQIARERFRAAVTADLSRPAALGWLLLDRGAIVLDAVMDGALPPGIRILSGPNGARLHFEDGSIAARWSAALDRVAADPSAPHQAVWLGSRATAYLRIAPYARSWRGSHPPVAIATLHGCFAVPTGYRALLADLFGLSRTETGLAIALANGDSLVEAAAARRLTIETARNYSKRIFAKTGARGQADLVRLIYAHGLGEPPPDIVSAIEGGAAAALR